MKKTIIVTALSSLVFSFSAAHAGSATSSVFSDNSGGGASSSSFYGGASVGRTYQDNCDELSGSTEGGNYTCSRENGSSAWKIYGGYKVMPNFAIEGGYIDFGEYSTIHKLEATEEDPSYEAKGISLMAVGIAPVSERVNIFGKLGVLRWEQDIKDPNNPEQGTLHNEGTDLAIGAGAEVKLHENVSLRGEVEHFEDLDANLFSVGVTFNTM